MILDHINNCEQYFTLHPNFKLGFDFIRSFNPSNFKEGKNEILGDEVFTLVFNLKKIEKLKLITIKKISTFLL